MWKGRHRALSECTTTSDVHIETDLRLTNQSSQSSRFRKNQCNSLRRLLVLNFVRTEQCISFNVCTGRHCVFRQCSMTGTAGGGGGGCRVFPRCLQGQGHQTSATTPGGAVRGRLKSVFEFSNSATVHSCRNAVRETFRSFLGFLEPKMVPLPPPRHPAVTTSAAHARCHPKANDVQSDVSMAVVTS